MKLAFYRADHGGRIDAIIAAVDNGPYSHVELVFDGISGECFSSSIRDGGTRFKRIDLNDGKWDLYDVPCSNDEETDVWLWCHSQLHKPYDLLGVLAFKLPTRQDGKAWFCSEVCTAALQRISLLSGLVPHKTSPNALSRNFRRVA
jgi:hypothetical protein